MTLDASTALEIVVLTLKVGVVATLASAAPGIALGWWLGRRQSRLKPLVQALASLPMVVPPVGVGLALLLLLSRRGPLGALGLVFTWQAAAVAAAVMSFPLLVRAAEQAFAEVPERLEQVARTLGAGRWSVFWRVTLPLARRGVAYGLVFAFARALGEFGATILVAGSIPHQTETLALGIHARIQAGDDAAAAVLAGISAAIALAATFAAETFLRERRA